MILALFVIMGLGSMVAPCLIVRNDAVFRYRNGLLDLIGDAIDVDFSVPNIGRVDFDWRYKAFQAVPYNAMVLQFWRPLKSFYPDMSFTEAA